MSDVYYPNDPDRAPIGITVGPRVQDLVTQEAPPEAPANPLEYLYGSPAATAQDPTHANALTKILASAMRDAKNFVVDTATAPYRLVNAAARQDYSKGLDTEIDPEMLTAALSSAGLVMGGGMPMAPKGAVGMSGGRLIQPPKVEGPFYSAVEQAIAAAPQDKMTVPQWKGYLRNQPGVKAEELDWMGLGDKALHPKEWGVKPVTREQLLEHAQGHGVQIKEIEKAGEGEPPEYHHRAYDRALEYAEDEMRPRFEEEHPEFKGEWDSPEAEDAWEAFTEKNFNEWDALQSRHLEDNEEPISGAVGGSAGGTKYHDYQLPGGDNYRETLLTLPERRLKDGRTPDRHDPAQQDLGNYHSPHWDEPNVLVHMRMNDRELPDVGKSLHLEEIQSDWHQQGRKQGYKGADTPARAEVVAANEKKNQTGQELYRYIDAENSKHNYGMKPVDVLQMAQDLQNGVRYTQEHWLNQPSFKSPEFEQIRKAAEVANREHANKFDLMNKGVPDAPFKSTWADLALKRAITKAAREGYDAVSWTPGAQQAERYDLSKHIDKLELTHNRDGIGQLKYWTKNGQDLKLINSKSDLVNFVGKDIAEKLYKQGRENNGKASLSGVDLRVGGEGMKAFYDKMLVDKANAIAKKFGTKVEYQRLDPGLEINEIPVGNDPVKGLWRPVQGDGGYAVISGTGFTVKGGFPTEKAAKAYIEENKKPRTAFVVDNPNDPNLSNRQFQTRAEAEKYLEQQNVRVPVLRLTPKLREIAERRGMPLFAKGLPFRFTPVDHDPFNKDDK